MRTLLAALKAYGISILSNDEIKTVDPFLTLNDSILKALNKPFTGDLTVDDLYFALKDILDPAQDDVEREIDYIFGLITPAQHKVNAEFWSLYNTNPVLATQYLYALGKHNHYIQIDKVKLNRQYTQDGLIITINLSKEEKDNKKIAEMAKMPPSTFPKCVLCFENVGYKGSGQQPPRSTLRVAELTLDKQPWFMQYSPYPYFEEHAIFIDKTHRPMRVDAHSIQQLIEIVDLFPDYFVGSNAAMPIIGGSILSHAHFQGGKRQAFPLMLANITDTFTNIQFPQVSISTLDWTSFVLRLESKNAKTLKECIVNYMEKWSVFEAEDIGLIPETNGVPHHGVAPIIYKKNGTYIAHLIFRSNITSYLYPEGVFHAHPEFHHIKKEGIGLIEAMGMFILPGRLARVLDHYMNLTSLSEFYQLVEQYPLHKSWLLEYLLPTGFETEHLKERFLSALSFVCKEILTNISVFKNNPLGHQYQNKFLKRTR
ncbi:hypothetical protein [Paracholeplasma manati]|uniref:hypothetical protein n=1 Tax=Paracholeplasma manati TaxID=591373 RepID=UPI0024081CD9|nr:hypothetical protein [Paracholeplasma manati]MDG0888983.1 hypothetical protein [Paracholeplasma manati]